MIRLVSILLLCLPAFAGTQILDTITNPDGTLFSGALTITGPRQTTASGNTTISGVFKKDITITAGTLDITLESNDVLVPAGTSYGARYQSNNGVSRFEYWVIPASATPLKIINILTSTIPTPALSFALSQISAVGAVAGDLMRFTTSWGRLPIGTNGQVLTVDTSLTGKLKWATGAGGDLGFTAANVANNLSDLASASTARTNLGLGTAATSAASAFEGPLTFNAPLSRDGNAISLDATPGVGTVTSVGATVPAWLSVSGSPVTGAGTLAITPATGQTAGQVLATPSGATGAVGLRALAASDIPALAYQAALGFTPPPNTLTLSVTGPIAGGGSLAANRTFGCTTCVTSAAALDDTYVVVGAGSQGTKKSLCTVDVTGQMSCPNGFSAGSPGSVSSFDLSNTGGVSTFHPGAVAGNINLTFPAATDTIMGQLTPVLAAQMPTILSTPIPIPGAVFKSAAVNNAAIGDVDIYTTLAGRRASIGTVACYNTAGSSTTLIPKIKISGTYYRLGANSIVSPGAVGSQAITTILEPGDSVALNFSQAGCNCWATVIDYPSTVPIYSPRLTSLSTGDNTIYTVPPSRTAISLISSTLSVTGGTGAYITDTAHTVKWYVVNSGGSTGSTNQATASTAVSANIASSLTPFKTGAAGDFVVVNTDGATGVQFAWMTVLELP